VRLTDLRVTALRVVVTCNSTVCCGYVLWLFVKVAEAALSRLHHLPSLQWKVEEAELFWAREELDTAKHKMKMLIDDADAVCFSF